MTSASLKPRSSIEVEKLAIFVHGMLAAGHLLGVVYNAKRGNVFDVTAHSLAFVYDIYATSKHLKRSHATDTGV